MHIENFVLILPSLISLASPFGDLLVYLIKKYGQGTYYLLYNLFLVIGGWTGGLGAKIMCSSYYSYQNLSIDIFELTYLLKYGMRH